MAHPFHEHKQHKVEKQRVGHITRGYASGGAVRHEEAEEAESTAKRAKRGGMMAEGKKAKHRHDRMPRAKGGRAKGKGATHVNVIIGGQKDNTPPMPVPVPAGGPPMPPPGMGAMAPHPPIGSPPPGAGAVPMIPRKKGGRVKSGPAYDEGKRNGTQVQHSDGLGSTNTKANLDRGRPVTFKAGGKVVSFRATGGRTEAPPYGKAMGPDLEAGVLTGEGRLKQAKRGASRYAKPMRETNGAR